MTDTDTDAPSLARHLADGLRCLDPGGPVRFVTLATRARLGGAAARMVVLRALDSESMKLRMHTNAMSAKCTEIAADPSGEILAWDPDRRLQVRARVILSERAGTPTEWQALPASERLNYSGAPAPNAPLASPDTAPLPDPSAFSILSARIEALDILRLGKSRHIRARYDRSNRFSGTWIGP